MMAEKAQFVYKHDVLEPADVGYWIARIENAETEWKLMQQGGTLPKIAKRTWPGLVKFMGRVMATSDKSKKDLVRRVAVAFTELNEQCLQKSIQIQKLTYEPVLRLVLNTTKLYNNTVEQGIYVCEATAEDMNYSVNADFKLQILTSAAVVHKDLPNIQGWALLTKCLDLLLMNHINRDKDLTDAKSLVYGIPCVGKDILGATLRHAILVS